MIPYERPMLFDSGTRGFSSSRGVSNGVMAMDDSFADFAAFVRLVIEALEAAGVDYLLGGAVAAWAWGEPRATLDLDVVADIPLEAADRLSAELEERGMPVPAEAIRETILEDQVDLPINATHMEAGYKGDIYPLRPGDQLRRSALDRRRAVDLGPDLGQVYLHSPEDLIVYKLVYYALTAQAEHVRDITAVALGVGDDLDLDYIAGWAGRLGLNTLWEELLGMVRP
jgi:hypothetical protein